MLEKVGYISLIIRHKGCAVKAVQNQQRCTKMEILFQPDLHIPVHTKSKNIYTISLYFVNGVIVCQRIHIIFYRLHLYNPPCASKYMFHYRSLPSRFLSLSTSQRLPVVLDLTHCRPIIFKKICHNHAVTWQCKNK